MSEQFFYDHAGWGYHPDKETPEEGRRRGARALVEAERYARDHDWWYRWDSELGMIDHVTEFVCYDTEPETCESCALYAEDGELLGSLGCIDDATPEYRRVVEAELALEAMPER
jgi:hypothetical protein